jgi:hypothetical protein
MPVVWPESIFRLVSKTNEAGEVLNRVARFFDHRRSGRNCCLVLVHRTERSHVAAAAQAQGALGMTDT